MEETNDYLREYYGGGEYCFRMTRKILKEMLEKGLIDIDEALYLAIRTGKESVSAAEESHLNQEGIAFTKVLKIHSENSIPNF